MSQIGNFRIMEMLIEVGVPLSLSGAWTHMFFFGGEASNAPPSMSLEVISWWPPVAKSTAAVC